MTFNDTATGAEEDAPFPRRESVQVYSLAPCKPATLTIAFNSEGVTPLAALSVSQLHEFAGITENSTSFVGFSLIIDMVCAVGGDAKARPANGAPASGSDRKSTRLNSSHRTVSRMPSSA